MIQQYFNGVVKQESRKRTFEQIRDNILLCLKDQMTINQIAHDTDTNWRTVEHHLTYLLGKGFVKEVFKSEYVRIFDITSKGKEHIRDKLNEFDEFSIEAYQEES